MKRRVAPPEGGAGQTSREWYRPLPPYREVVWSMRNNTNYMQTGVLSALQYASSFPDVIVENFYRKSRNSIEAGAEGGAVRVRRAGRAEGPDARRPAGDAAARQGIEVGRTTGELKLSDGTYAAGSFVIKRDQPYGRLAKTLLEKQTFPDPPAHLRRHRLDDGPDAAGGREADRRQGGARRAVARPSRTSRVRGTVDRRADARRLGRRPPRLQRHGPAAARARRDADVRAATAPFKVGEVTYPAGSFLVPASAGAPLTDAVTRLGPRRHRPGGDARRRDDAGGPAAPGDVLHVGPHAGSRLGAARLRHVRDPLRADLQGAHPAGRPARGLRRHPDSQPGDDRQVAGVRRRAQGRAARLQARTRSSRRSARTASPTTSPAAWGSRASSSCRSSSRRAAC